MNLEGKSESEIRRAAAWWYTCKEAWIDGQEIPQDVFAICVADIPDEQIQKFVARVQEIEAQLPKLDG